jgi:hypothetical protein
MLKESKDISHLFRQIKKDSDGENDTSPRHRSKSVDDFFLKGIHAQQFKRNQSTDNINQTEY